jgi:UDP-glucose 4-epimerase
VKDPISCFQVNVAGTVNLLEAVRVHGSRAHVVLASSAAVYGVAPQTRASETDPPAPASPYAASKLAAEAWTEAYSRCYGIKALVFRFFNVFGPLQGADHAYAAAVPALVEAALAGRPLTIHGDGRQTRDFVSVDDVASLLTTAVVDGVTSETPVNLAVGHHMSLLQLVEGIELVLEQHLERRHVGPRPGDVRHSQADISLLSELFPATAPTPFLQALTATVEWARSQPRLQG